MAPQYESDNLMSDGEAMAEDDLMSDDQGLDDVFDGEDESGGSDNSPMRARLEPDDQSFASVLTDLVRCHRTHIREMSELERQEKQLVANNTVEDRNLEPYIKQLDELMEKKIQSIMEVRRKLTEVQSL
ncbi:hypothetical protein BC832DRAFT_215394 [Gaertneriomyces semiglobifer]|nr:hypothetical protein BC832DRAFT_215394 [Gaertneriomyces semiglobifer]